MQARRVGDLSPIPHPDASSASAGREPPPAGLTTTSRGHRRYELDWLRVIVVLGLIPYHAAIVFAVGPGDYIQNNQRSLVFDAGATLVAFIGMPLLFVIAGAATWYALGHRSSSQYLVERVQRLAVPLVFGILALVPIQLYFSDLNQPGNHLNYPQFYGQFLDNWAHIAQIGVFGHGFEYWGHLWFLLYLLAVSVFLLPLLVWLRRGPGQRHPTQLARIATGPLGLVLLGVPLGLVEVVLQGPIGPNPLVDYANLYGGAAGLVLYAVTFLLGYLLVPDATFQRAVVRYRTLFLALAILLLALHELVLGAFGVPTLGGSLAMPIVRLLRGLITWCLIVSALGYAARYWTAGTRLLGSLTEASFPLYVLHMPILTIFAFSIVRWDVPVIVKFVTLVALTAIVTVAVYEIMVRRIPMLRFLFGLKPAAPPSLPAEQVSRAPGAADALSR